MFSIALLGIAVVIVAEGGLALLGSSVPAPDVVVGQRSSRQVRATSRQTPHIVVRAVGLHLPHGACRSTTSATSCARASTSAGACCEVRDGKRQRGERFADAPLDGPLLEVDDVAHRLQDRPRASCARSTASRSRLERGKTLGIVGESGCGKSVLSRSIMGLLAAQRRARTGSILFEGREIGQASTPTSMRDLWGTQMAMVFQDPMTSLNPVMKIGKQITESLRHHLDVSKEYADETALVAAAVGRDPRSERGA